MLCSDPALKYTKQPNKILFIIVNYCSIQIYVTLYNDKKHNMLAKKNILTVFLPYFFDTVTEKEIRQWHKGFLKDCPNGLLTEQVIDFNIDNIFPQLDR